jgi:hypothetical protein
MKFIRISINEFKSLLNRACESHYGHQYDYEDLAYIIHWLELHNFEGVTNFLKIINSAPQKSDLSTDLAENQEQRLKFNNNGHSILHVASIITDMTLAKCHQEQFCHTSIKDVLHPVTILPSLIKFSQNGWHASAWWTEPEKDLAQVASISPDQKYPEYKEIKIKELSPNDKSDLNLICSRNEINSLESYTTIHKNNNSHKTTLKISANDFKESYTDKIINGLNIDTKNYQKLSLIADQILVEASEQSRLGAGE